MGHVTTISRSGSGVGDSVLSHVSVGTDWVDADGVGMDGVRADGVQTDRVGGVVRGGVDGLVNVRDRKAVTGETGLVGVVVTRSVRGVLTERVSTIGVGTGAGMLGVHAQLVANLLHDADLGLAVRAEFWNGALFVDHAHHAADLLDETDLGLTVRSKFLFNAFLVAHADHAADLVDQPADTSLMLTLVTFLTFMTLLTLMVLMILVN